jgi:zinc protease
MKCKKILSVLSFLFFAYFTYAEETPVPNLYQYKLDNGLMLFVAENHAVPLAYIEIAVKCGAYTQTPETAGLFHLYEHMMFKGNSLYPNAAAVQDALSKLGVASWNGTTSLECVNYFFTIPSDKIEDGLNFWNSAIRFPLLDKRELENEKKL